MVGGWTGQKQAPPPLLKILGVGFLVGVVPLEELLSKFHEAFFSGTTWGSMLVGSHALATAYTFTCENVLGAFLVQILKLGVFKILGGYPMLLDDLAEKAPVIALELGHGVSVIPALCVIFIFSTSTRSRSVCSGRICLCCSWVDDLFDAWW